MLVFSQDSCPDRWGRLLMKRREAILAKKEDRKPKRLTEMDFLLEFTMKRGWALCALQKKKTALILQMIRIWQLRHGQPLESLNQHRWPLKRTMTGWRNYGLNSPFSTGVFSWRARPKASVEAPDGSLWILKFPSQNDDMNKGMGNGGS